MLYSGAGRDTRLFKLCRQCSKSGKVLEIRWLHRNGVCLCWTTNDVLNACVKGRESECKRTAFKEYGKFGASTLTGVGAGAAGSFAGVGVCAAIGIATAGTGAVVCASVGSIAAGYDMQVLKRVIL